MTEFYDRSNLYEAGVFYDRSNVFSENDITQRKVFSGVDLSFNSLAYKAPFPVVDGDAITVPLVVAGSALELDQSGRFVFSPPVPDGTTFTRDLYRASTGQTFTDTITVYSTGATASDVGIAYYLQQQV